jgi:hypothetical protein
VVMIAVLIVCARSLKACGGWALVGVSWLTLDP